MPPRKLLKAPSGVTIAGPFGTVILGMAATLITTGIVSMIVLYSHVATLTEQELRTEQLLQRHLDHSVDRDEYLRRDAQIQRAIDSMATREDIRTLRSMMLDILGGNPRADKYRQQ